MKIVSSCSWTWRKLLQLRHYIWSSVSASFWYSHGASSLVVLSIIVFGHGHSFLFLLLISSEPHPSTPDSSHLGEGAPCSKTRHPMLGMPLDLTILVARHKVVWFSKNIPRHGFSFILWMAVKGNLRTKDKLYS